MKKSLVNIVRLSFFLVPLLACTALKTTDSEAQAPLETKLDLKKCVCVQLWMPVCGENGKTYSNSCFANCAGVKFKQGSCSKAVTD